MKPNASTVTTPPANSSLSALPSAKIVRHPRSKKEPESAHLSPPDEETLHRLNVLAKQSPFCRTYKGSNSPLL
ncbi:hypothetical protein [Puia sp.]|uniref:hypothetical protein n=1 Tax=Puia sp. TaxID=2045100 RepID=UPI002F40075E